MQIPSLNLSPRNGVDAGQGLTPLIQRSWERCAQLDPVRLADAAPVPRADLGVRRERQRRLLELAGPELAALESLAGSAHSVVLLADASGLILHESGDTSFLGKARRLALQPGVSWAESHRGTNAIGTALLEGRSVRVHGHEHFLPCNRVLSCHAAPIFSGTGESLGILDLSGPAEDIQGYALGLVSMYAGLISNRLLRDTPLRRLVFQTDPSLLDGAEQAILLVDDKQRIAGANSVALRLLETDWALVGTPMERWIDGALSIGKAPGALHRHDGKPLVGMLHVPGPRLHAPAISRKATPDDGLPELDDVMNGLLEQAVRATDAGLSLLLQGETGTGKEVLARRIHAQSRWRVGRFVAINCGALPESLAESELFGYEGGAFTGARREGARGLLRQAHEGILFLDEIGDMPLALQTRLLRVLQEREVQPLGAEKSVPLEFGLISASHRDLKTMVDSGMFRADLYYRLQDLRIPLPPLRDRANLPHYLRRHLAGLADRCDDDALEALYRYGWPGNYRELHSITRRLACLYPAPTRIDRNMLPAEIQALHAGTPSNHPIGSTAPPYQETEACDPSSSTSLRLRELERSAIDAALRASKGNISLAARALGIHRSTLYRLMKRPPPQS